MERANLSQISGNAPKNIKEILVQWINIFRADGTRFANTAASHLKLVEASIVPNAVAPSIRDGRVIFELEVTDDMVNIHGTLDEGFSIFLIDECSSFALLVALADRGKNPHPGVSQTISTAFHSQAPVGAKLKIVCTSVDTGDAAMAATAEIWNADKQILVASASHLKMLPSRRPQMQTKL